MLLTIDVGNTNIVFAVFAEEECVLESRIDTNSARMADQYAIMLGDIMRLYNVDVSAVTGSIISSVVPPVTRQVVLAVECLCKITPLIVESGIKTGLNIKIDNPADLGADLVCGAVAAKTLYKCPCIAIDMGTVTKVMALGKDGALLGGVLCPGVGMGFKSMANSTALLPLVSGNKAEKVIGTNTTDCISGGIIYGTACMLDGLIDRFEAEIGESCTVVATGGFSEVIVPNCKREIEVDKSLVSQGLRIIYKRNLDSAKNRV